MKYYSASRPEIVKLVPFESKKILDVGCGCGTLGKDLKARNACHVTGVEIYSEAAQIAKKVLDHVFTSCIEDIIQELPTNQFDCIILSDVLEHIVNYVETLQDLKTRLIDNGCFVFSIPNISHWSVVRSLLQGHWDYTAGGILDRTHVRFFTLDSIIKLLHENGLFIEESNALFYGGPGIPTRLIKHLSREGLDVISLKTESICYQYLFRAAIKTTQIYH